MVNSKPFPCLSKLWFILIELNRNREKERKKEERQRKKERRKKEKGERKRELSSSRLSRLNE